MSDPRSLKNMKILFSHFYFHGCWVFPSLVSYIFPSQSIYNIIIKNYEIAVRNVVMIRVVSIFRYLSCGTEKTHTANVCTPKRVSPTASLQCKHPCHMHRAYYFDVINFREQKRDRWEPVTFYAHHNSWLVLAPLWHWIILFNFYSINSKLKKLHETDECIRKRIHFANLCYIWLHKLQLNMRKNSAFCNGLKLMSRHRLIIYNLIINIC